MRANVKRRSGGPRNILSRRECGFIPTGAGLGIPSTWVINGLVGSEQGSAVSISSRVTGLSMSPSIIGRLQSPRNRRPRCALRNGIRLDPVPLRDRKFQIETDDPAETSNWRSGFN